MTHKQSKEEYWEAKERERAERARECHHGRDCAADGDETEQCEECGVYFCLDHLFDGFCASCFEIEAAADLILAEAA